MKDRVARVEPQFVGELRVGDGRAHLEHLRPIRMAARGDFIRDAADRDQRRFVFRRRDVRAGAARAREHLLGRQLAQRAVDRHPRDVEFARELVLRRHLVAFRPLARVDAREDEVLDFLIDRCGHGVAVQVTAAACRRSPAFVRGPGGVYRVRCGTRPAIDA